MSVLSFVHCCCLLAAVEKFVKIWLSNLLISENQPFFKFLISTETVIKRRFTHGLPKYKTQIVFSNVIVTRGLVLVCLVTEFQCPISSIIKNVLFGIREIIIFLS